MLILRTVDGEQCEQVSQEKIMRVVKDAAELTGVGYREKVQRSNRRRAVYSWSLLFFVVLFCLTLAEVALRLMDRPQYPIVGWKWKGAKQEANEYGFRGHRLTERADTTVLLLGDSQVESMRPFSEMPELLLKDALKQTTKRDVNIVSIGSRGWGQDQQLLALEKYVADIHPQVVALWLTPTNDLWNNTFPTHFPKDGWPKPTFWLEGEELVGPDASWMEPYRQQRFYVLRLLDRLRGIRPFVSDADWEAKLPPAYQSSPPGPETAMSLRDFLAKQHGISPQDVPYFAEENFTNEKTHHSITLYPPSPRVEYSAKLTRALLLEISKVCEAHGSKLVIFYTDKSMPEVPNEPTSFDVGGRRVTLSSNSAKVLIDKMLTGFSVIQITGFPENCFVSNTDYHLNTTGNGYVMSQLANWLVSHRWLPTNQPPARNNSEEPSSSRSTN